MDNKDVSPKVHLFGKLDKLHDDQLIMIVLPEGEKLQTTIVELKQFIQGDVLKRLEEVEKKVDNLKIDRKTVIDAFKRANSIGFGKPFNILADVGIEKLKGKGIIYSDGKRVRVNLDGKWHTLKLDNE